jgi:hypothetical protein
MRMLFGDDVGGCAAGSSRPVAVTLLSPPKWQQDWRGGAGGGVAGVLDGLSPEARAYFAAGGLGILIGDGTLNYQPEKILETYYSYRLST